MKKILTFLLAAMSLTALAQTDSTEVKKDSVEGFVFTNTDAYAKQERQMPELPDGTMAVGNLGERHVVLRVES